MIALLAVSLLLAACAPAGETLAGEGYKIPKNVRPVPVDTGIQKGELFLLQAPVRAPSDSNTVGEILEYRGADRSSQTSPKILFKLWSTGETLEYTLSNQVIIHLGGRAFQVNVLNPAVIDSAIKVDFNGDGTIDRSTSSKLYNGGAAGVMGTGVKCVNVITPYVGETVTDRSTYPTGIEGQNLTINYVDHEKIKVESSGQYAEIALGKSATVGLLNVHLLHLLNQDYAGGIHQATLCIN